ncbi:hypothetical protein [Paenibacillus spongiae]|uniref:Glycosyl hydrolase family 32 N-terminal domain-containing protein n=1 Tax=Paenibacillus spongiae TaxID=2909671 RepID=A0ABY5S708_9BACL|nr:hypothetical protein [Paenibacillus spongiae]UVI29692.1 hypothetical protein L1F29_30510 [Paenibacillus spongiae]
MYIKVIDLNKNPYKAAWENYTLFYEGHYYAMFNVRSNINELNNSSYAIDLFKSKDGVHWELFCEDTLPIVGSHGGFSFHRFGDYFMYHPTCTNPQKGIHFKSYRSRNLLEWEHLGDTYDVGIDNRYYEQRWDEIVVLDDVDADGNEVYFGYISSEVRNDIGPPSCGMLKSRDGLEWEILPPPVIHWGTTPPHHMEVNFCEKMNGKYYLNMSGRQYMDSLGYSLYTFVADQPEGPYVPDREMFRLCGTSHHEITWLSHTIHSPEGILCATWLCKGTSPAVPSQSFTIAPFKRLLNVDGHLRLGYWSGNDAAKGEETRLSKLDIVHPLPQVKGERDHYRLEKDKFIIQASRDGIILMFEKMFDVQKGFIIEGNVELCESRTLIETHHHAAHIGIYMESGTNSGTAMVVDTHGVTRTGYIQYSDHKISDYNFRKDIYSGMGLVDGRSGPLKGTLAFDCQDTAGPYGHANASDLRHGSRHTIRILARGDFMELYVDDYYVQTFYVPETFTGRVGIVVSDGVAECESFRAWEMNID